MTKTEISQLGNATTDIDKSLDALNTDIGTAAGDYCSKKANAEGKIIDLRAQIQSVHSQAENPVDFVNTAIKQLPLSSDTMNMDVQYFSNNSNQQDSASFASSISSFVSASTKARGAGRASMQMGAAAQQQVSSQVQQHNIVGTLVLSVSCTHKAASVLAPLVINVDKGIKAWNHLYPGDKMDALDAQAMNKILEQPEGEDRFTIISGMTYGSSFVGMVHLLNTTDTKASEAAMSAASNIQAQMQIGTLISGYSGGFGVDSSIGSDVKKLLSTQNITAHVTLISMGAIPSMVANDVQLAVKSFSQFDPASAMATVATIKNATAADHNSANASAEKARTGESMVALKTSDMKAALSALEEIQDGKNKIIDINSMMTALDDYLKKAASGECGTPINYYLQDIYKEQLAEMWVSKYFPGEF